MSERSISIPNLMPLPTADDLNIAALSRLFIDKTNSYKFVFFISILDILKRRKFDVSESIAFRELIIEMLANAWYPHTYFKLSFGTQDQIVKNLDLLNLEIGEPILKFTDTDKKLLRETIASQALDRIIRNLARYVPFRLIVPFLEAELQAVPERGKGNNLDLAVPEIAMRCFSESKPLYRFNSDRSSECNAIVFHPDWAIYLERHYSIIRGWAAWEWLEYMQRRNPSTPGLIYKLFAPSKRSSLSEQTKFWKIVLANTDFQCIYSDLQLDVNRFSLDHYLPWSFVAHDRLWNLIPTSHELNSSKSNNLPSDRSFQKFVNAQHLGLTICHDRMSAREWNKTVESYIEDLGIHTQEDLIDREKLMNAYSNLIQPLLSLAINQGFKLWQHDL
jgi:HNH endonuclease